MSVSDEQYERVCDFTDTLITEKEEWTRRALEAERCLILAKVMAYIGWLLWLFLIISVAFD